MSIPVNRIRSESIPLNRLEPLMDLEIERASRLERRRRARSLDSTISIVKTVELSSSLRLFADEGVVSTARKQKASCGGAQSMASDQPSYSLPYKSRKTNEATNRLQLLGSALRNTV